MMRGKNRPSRGQSPASRAHAGESRLQSIPLRHVIDSLPDGVVVAGTAPNWPDGHVDPDLFDVFIREKVFRGREQKVLSQLRELVRWLRLEGGAGESRELEVLDSRTVASYESLRLPATAPGEMRGFAVRLRLMKRLRAS